MLTSLIPRQNHHSLSLSSILHRHFCSSSKLRTKYSFIAPPPQNPNPNPNPKPSKTPNSPQKSPKKPPYRPPSSLETGKKPLQSKLPFDFRYSYTESSPSVKPIGLRGPKYSPFGPGRLTRVWTGVCAPVKNPKVTSVDGDVEEDPKVEERRRAAREKLIGAPLTETERKILVDSCHKSKTKRQINLGRDGLTHNMLNEIHNHWRERDAEAIRIKCMGVPTVDMDNICTQLEDKSYGKIIHRHGSLLVLYRGRKYKPKKRPFIPLMLWKPQEPVYPRVVKTTIEGLSIEETKALRKRGLAVPALIKLAKNGYYGNLVAMVRDAFLVVDLVRIDCTGLDKSDRKKLGVKLRDLVPCIPVTFMKEQIVLWRGPGDEPADCAESEHKLAEQEPLRKTVDDLVWDS